MFVDDLAVPVLAADDHHHLARVRRVRDGDSLVLADGRGAWCTGRMAGEYPERDDEVRTIGRPNPSIGVAFALVKGTKPELVVQKLTELGVDVIVPFVAERSVVVWDQRKAEAAQVRLERVAREAAMQSRRAWLPTVEPVTTFDEVAAREGVSRADRGGGPITLARPLVLVGPEGGWSDAERGRDLPVVALGDGVLRAETAAIAAGSLLAALRWGAVGHAS